MLQLILVSLMISLPQRAQNSTKLFTGRLVSGFSGVPPPIMPRHGSQLIAGTWSDGWGSCNIRMVGQSSHWWAETLLLTHMAEVLPWTTSLQRHSGSCDCMLWRGLPQKGNSSECGCTSTMCGSHLVIFWYCRLSAQLRHPQLGVWPKCAAKAPGMQSSRLTSCDRRRTVLSWHGGRRYGSSYQGWLTVALKSIPTPSNMTLTYFQCSPTSIGSTHSSIVPIWVWCESWQGKPLSLRIKKIAALHANEHVFWS